MPSNTSRLRKIQTPPVPNMEMLINLDVDEASKKLDEMEEKVKKSEAFYKGRESEFM